MDKVDELYGHVDGLLHQLTLQSNRRVQALELVQMLEAQEGELHQVGAVCPEGLVPDLKHDPHPTTAPFSLLVPPQIEVWLQQVGWPALKEPREPSLDMLLQAQSSFQEVDQVAQVV